MQSALDEAYDWRTSTSRLAELARHEDSHVRAAVAGNLSAAEDTRITLAADPYATVRRRVASYLNTPETLAELFEDEDLEVRCAAAGNPLLPSNLLQKAANDRDSLIRTGAASNSQLPATLLRRLATDPVASVRFAVAGNSSNTPADCVETLAHDVESIVRASAASHPALPLPLLEQLVYDPVDFVWKAARINPNAHLIPEAIWVETALMHLGEA